MLRASDSKKARDRFQRTMAEAVERANRDAYKANLFNLFERIGTANKLQSLTQGLATAEAKTQNLQTELAEADKVKNDLIDDRKAEEEFRHKKFMDVPTEPRYGLMYDGGFVEMSDGKKLIGKGDTMDELFETISKSAEGTDNDGRRVTKTSQEAFQGLIIDLADKKTAGSKGGHFEKKEAFNEAFDEWKSADQADKNDRWEDLYEAAKNFLEGYEKTYAKTWKADLLRDLFKNGAYDKWTLIDKQKK
jgi:hypothetical protein